MNSNANKSITLSWEELHQKTNALAEQLAKIGPFSGIVTVSRGGLVPAAIISRKLSIRLVETVAVASYDRQTRGAVEILKLPTAANKGKGWLLIDDLADTGETIKALRDILPDAHFATIYAKPEGKAVVDTFVAEASQDTWIYFPWED